MFTSARDVLERERRDVPRSNALERRETNREMKRDGCVDDDDETDDATEAKRRRVRMGESKSRAVMSEPKQLSLADAFAVGGTTRTRTTSTTGRNARGTRRRGTLAEGPAAAALAYAPASAFTDVRLVCKAWRDAVDDDGFLPMLKLNRSLAVGDEETRTEASERLRRATGRRRGDVGFAPLVEYIATKGSTSFKTMLDVESFRRCVEEDEYLSGASAPSASRRRMKRIGETSRRRRVDRFSERSATFRRR